MAVNSAETSGPKYPYTFNSVYISGHVSAASPVMYSFFNLSVTPAATVVVPPEETPVISAAISGVIKVPALCGPKLTCI
jgi:hypothetical protein